MSQEYINPLTNLSYTNKDFSNVYAELLDLVKELTYKWDPSISNESDPGVILLKLNAIIADKCNYNIDKNTLECFPLTVTQESNARQLFEQLGYYMHWNESATTDIVLQWIGKSVGKSYTIPSFTMVSDYDNSIIYTLVGNASTNGFIVNSQKLNDNGDYLKFKAIQGIAVKYDINGSTIITSNMLDSNNRLYFTNSNIAQNGIFICNTGTNNYSQWERRDNLLVESLGNHYYKFGVSKDKTSCYLEFPMDVEQIFGSGIEITYIKTDSEDGNIAANIIEKFYNDLVPIEDSTIILNSDNVRITNYSSATDGKSPELISKAYDGYKKTVGTFNTLVTLRDYINYINKSNLVSNSFVCDRTNDVQCCYNIMSSVNSIDQEITSIETKYSNKLSPVKLSNSTETNAYIKEKLLDAFSLKLYMLQYQKDVDTPDKFNSTFDMLNNSNSENIKMYLQNIKSVQHDIKNLQSIDDTHSHVAYFINKYPLNCTIVTQYALTDTDKNEMRENIKNALYKNLNSKEIKFGESISIDYIYDIIIASDNRIKTLMIDNIEYTTYANYLDNSGRWHFEEINSDQNISHEITFTGITDATLIIDKDKFINKISSTKSGGICKFIINDSKKYLIKKYSNSESEYGLSLNYLGDLASAPTTAFENDAYHNTTDSLYYAYLSGVWTSINVVNRSVITSSPIANTYYLYSGVTFETIDDIVDPIAYGIKINSDTIAPSNDDYFTITIPRALQIKEEIYIKSILNGKTQFYINDEEFDYKLEQIYSNDYSQIKNIKTFSASRDLSISGSGTAETVYNIPNNSSIQLFAPNLIDDKIYSNGVKFEYCLTNTIISNISYELQANEYISFYWKDEDDTAAIYKYAIYGQGNIIKSTFELTSNDGASNIGRSLVSNLRNIGTISHSILYKDSEYDGDMSYSISLQLNSLVSIYNRLSGSKNITTKRFNKVTLDNTAFCYWILNNKINNNYELFSANGATEYILDTGEYFLYTDNASAYFTILGAGTTIERSDNSSKWSVQTLDTSDVLNQGLSVLIDAWFKIPSSTTASLIENQYLTIGSSYQISLSKPTGVGAWNIVFKKDGVYSNSVKTNLSDFNIKYRATSNDSWTLIPSIDLQDTTGWNGKSIYAVNTSNNEEQEMIVGTSASVVFTFELSDGTISTISPVADADNTSMYFMTSIPIDAINATNLDVTTLDDSENIKYMSFYCYKKYPSSITNVNGSTITYNSDGDVIINIPSGETSATFNVQMFNSTGNSEYIIPMTIDDTTIANEALSSLQVTYDSTLLHSMYSVDDTNLNRFQQTYLYLPVADTNQHSITFTISASTIDTIISLKNVYKYVLPEIQYVSSEITNEQISSLIGQISSADHLFNFTYQVPSDYEISNPIKAESFLNSNHIFNPFTICKLDTNKINLQIISK